MHALGGARRVEPLLLLHPAALLSVALSRRAAPQLPACACSCGCSTLCSGPRDWRGRFASERESPAASRMAVSFLRWYKRNLSPLLPPGCRFIPTCSEYAVASFETFPPLQASILTAWRIIRQATGRGEGWGRGRGWLGGGEGEGGGEDEGAVGCDSLTFAFVEDFPRMPPFARALPSARL